MQPAIKVDGLSKHYRVGARQQGYKTLRESIADACWSPINRVKKSFARKAPLDASSNGAGQRMSGEDFWALKDVSFEVQPGEVVGIIGRNGAGKSTLLKILSRITEPTSGKIELRGRVGSLLEVGTGFHAELTGRENVFMNGSILGMTRREITKKFDEIVAFAEVEDFLDTPVKRYSSGMYVRLAFAVAAHLEPEILIVDEVLAVGDAVFQRKCIDRMSYLASRGGTILFVSHNMDIIPRLCSKAVLLERGTVAAQGHSDQIVRDYISQGSRIDDGELTNRFRSGSGTARFTVLQTLNQKLEPVIDCRSGDDLILRVEIEANARLADASLAFSLRSLTGANIISSWTRELNQKIELKAGLNSVQCRMREVRWRPGHPMIVSLWLEKGGVTLDHIEEARILEVSCTPQTEHLSSDRHQGSIIVDSDWTVLASGK